MLPRVVTSDEVVRQVGESMRRAAQREFVTANPSYSKDEAEAVARALVEKETLLKDETIQALIFPPRTMVSLVLTVDAFVEPKRWHLSMAHVVDAKPTIRRVPDALAKRIAGIILPESAEGPPEGAFKDARHFFAPYKAP